MLTLAARNRTSPAPPNTNMAFSALMPNVASLISSHTHSTWHGRTCYTHSLPGAVCAFPALLTGEMTLQAQWSGKCCGTRYIVEKMLTRRPRLDVNFAHLTPSLARILRPSKVPSLRRLCMIGEPLTASDVMRWRGTQVSVVNTYGPAETTVRALRSDPVAACFRPASKTMLIVFFYF